MVEKPESRVTSICVSPLFPDFVVIKTTQLDPLAQYIAVAAASFRISSDSMSLGFILASKFPPPWSI